MTILGAESQRSYGHREPVDGGEEALFTAGHSEQSEEKTEWQGLEEREGKPGARGGSGLGRSSTDREAAVAGLVLVWAAYRGGA